MRDKAEALHSCPVCGTEGAVPGLRDYSKWLFDLLPGRVGASDIDCVLDQGFSGRALALEFKPSKYIPRGQARLFDRLLAGGFDVWVVVDKDLETVFEEGAMKLKGDVTMCIYQPEQQVQTWKQVSIGEFRHAVRAWWDQGEA